MIGSDLQGLLAVFGVIAGIVLFILALIFVAVPLFKGIGWTVGAVFRGVGWIIMHVFDFVSGMLGDVLRFVGSLLVMLVLLPLVPVNIVIGRWSAAGHFAESFKREMSVGAACVYRAVIRRPLKFVLLDGVLEGLEQRLPEAMAAAPGADQPSRRVGQFDGYTIIGSLRSGGSGAKLYVAEPDESKRRKFAAMPDRVVIKAFALTEGSSLPQIVRESRALECAKQLGHVLDHGMDDHRFFYVMPYHPGDHLGVLTRQFHAESGNRGLDRRRLADVMSYTRDLLATLSAYHKGGLWHKDVKPENVIVHDGRAHLVDLGLVTPLRSAMTLTTHGTEYFRDPEMVRQALRGVKVHQVDGAKFDIYAVGAVLYFLIENTFPAHGGLSRITQSSPESLRWIVRRAMTEYQQRYATADDMLRDVQHVMSAGDPYAVKPADLPSMRGGAVEPEIAASVAHVRTPAASAVQGFGIAAGIGTAGPFAQVGRLNLDADGNPLPAPAAGGKRPKITVTNWWTGAYRVDDDGVAADPAASFESADARMFHGHASAFRAQAADFRTRVREGSMSARRAAKEQIRAARQRAQEMRARAAAHRRQFTGRHSSSSPWLFGIGFLSVAVVLGVLLVGFATLRPRPAMSPSTNVSSASLSPLLLVVDGGDLSNPRVQARIARIVAERRRQGYDVITSTAGDKDLRALVTQWWQDPKGPADEAIEDVLASRNAYGVLFTQITGDPRRDRNIKEQVVYSTRPDAGSRRRLPVETIVPAGAAPGLQYLVINDHPAKTDPRVEAVINSAIEAYRARGWKLDVNDNLEVEVRKLLPPGKVDAANKLPPMLREVLTSNSLGGVLRIDAAPGDGAPEQRVIVTIVNAADIPAPPEPLARPDGAGEIPAVPEAPAAPRPQSPESSAPLIG